MMKPLFLSLMLVAVSGLQAEETVQRRRPEVESAIALMSPTIVRIEVISEEGSDGRMLRQHAVGSGSIIDAEGHVITNYHVAGRGTTFLCRLADREELPATLVGADAMTDIAVIKLDLSRRRAKTPLPVARFADSAAAHVGDTVLSMGCPAGLTQSVTLGIIANDAMVMTRFVGGMNLDGESVGELVRWFGHDAVIFGGNSGGPLVDVTGRIVGINEIGVGSLGGAIPANTAKAVAEELMQKGHVVRGWVGIEVQPLLRSLVLQGKHGVLVAGVIEGTPAAGTGLRQGDILTSVQGHAVDADCAELMPAYYGLIASLKPGVPVEVVYTRDGAEHKINITPIERAANLPREVELSSWGLTVRNLTRLAALRAKRPNTDGVAVDSLRAGGPAAEAKPLLLENDILLSVAGRPIKDVDDLRKISRELLKGKTEPEPVLVTFDRSGTEMISVVRIGPEVDPAIAPRAARAWAGLSTQVLTAEITKALGLKGKAGVRVTQVLAGTNAEQAGLKVGDLILKLDDKVIPARRPEDAEVFNALLREYPVGTEVKLDILRGSQAQVINLKLVERPVPPSELPTVKDLRFGFSARQLSFDDKTQRKESLDTEGVIVTKVERSGWADLAGLRAGDIVLSINQTKVTDNVTLKQTLDALFVGKPRHVVLQVRHGLAGGYLEFEPNWSVLEAAK